MSVPSVRGENTRKGRRGIQLGAEYLGATPLGGDLRVARLRREQTIEEVSRRIGTGVRAVRDAESGKTSTGVGVYAALLWAYDLLDPLGALADPLNDQEGLALAGAKETKRARKRGAHSSLAKARKLLQRAGNEPPRDGDELP